jgi:nucleotidyltransferase substrate binding protein (TIGR01987 family)
MSALDIRWKQRFQNYGKALSHLEAALGIAHPDMVQKAGTLQFFEMSCELAWNVMKDYLEHQGFTDLRSPRGSIKKAFETGLVADGHGWMELIEARNLTAHAYDEAKADAVLESIREKFLPLLKNLQENLGTRLHD